MISQFVDALPHPSARVDAMTKARHRAFIVPRFIGSFIALAIFPVYLAWNGAPGALELLLFAWLMTQVVLAYYLSRTGNYERAQMLSSLTLTALVATVAAKSGGVESFAAIWLVLVPFEASLSASRRVIGVATALALGAALGLWLLGAMDLLPRSELGAAEQSLFMAVAAISAALYGACLAFGAEHLARTYFSRIDAEGNRYQLLARHMSDVISRHGRNGEVLFISPAAEALLATPAASLMGHGLFERVHIADRPAFLTALSGAARDGEEHGVEFRLRRGGSQARFAGEGLGTHRTSARQGGAPEFIWVEMRCRPLDQDGERAGDGREVVAVTRDVTERIRQQLALGEARADAERANAAKVRFLATMSHELRTPLNAIIGFSEMIAQERELSLSDDKRREYAGLIHESGLHLLSVVNDILNMSKIESGTFELDPRPFDPREVVASCCDLMALRARETGVDLVMNVPEGPLAITGDKRAFKQILINLLANAIKFSNRGGKVNIAMASQGANLMLSVEDTGIGIDDEDLRKLGEAFFQAGRTYDRRHEGTGLGLSIVKGLVGLHSGEIRFDSRLGEGTKVTVLLPLEFVPALGSGGTNVTNFSPPRADATQSGVRKIA